MTQSTTPQWEKDFDEKYAGAICDGTGSACQSTREDIKDFIRQLIAESIREERKWIKEELDGLLRLDGISHAEGMMKGWWVNYDEVQDLLTEESK
jgi:hypothetical protein